ncbi:MAG: GspE/PulE family protein [Kiritimatiellia bacterium]|nr:GspE/PulE family protein [Kiritimatiellia bacterium]
MTAPRTHSPTRNPGDVRARLGQELLRRGHLSQDRLEEIEHRAAWLEEPLDQLATREHLATPEELTAILSEITGIPVLPMADVRIDRELAGRIDPHLVARYHLMPIRMEGGVILLATDRIRQEEEEDHLRVLLGAPPRWTLCTPRELEECIKHVYGVGLETFVQMAQTGSRRKPSAPGDETETEANPNLSDFLLQVIRDAIRAGATDIHFEPEEERLRLRYRVDGVLHSVPLPVGIDRIRKAVLSSVKVMAQLNIAERRLPQDGRFSIDVDGRTCDLRVSVLPSRHGESVALRILNRDATFLQLDQLGLHPDLLTDLRDLLAQPHGMILFTGPTGSGKTTSLYASLAHLNDEQRKIVTLEDPIEYQIAGIVQMQVEPQIGFTFASGLRSILRHDPDVVLIGEIRDDETAGIAVSAALTGHLVFSTLHTNDSTAAANRLLDMGIEPYLAASSIDGIVAQRLVRCICPRCREPILDERIVADLRATGPELAATPVFYRGRGCPHCRFTGYSGRRAIFEILIVTDELRTLISERAPGNRMLDCARHLGLRTLRESGFQCVTEGLTTVEEVLRVTHRTRERNILKPGT